MGRRHADAARLGHASLPAELVAHGFHEAIRANPEFGQDFRADIAAVVAAVAPKPVNLLVGWASELTLDDIAALGVRRVSVGGALARSAWGGFQRAAAALVQGRFDGFADAATGQELRP